MRKMIMISCLLVVSSMAWGQTENTPDTAPVDSLASVQATVVTNQQGEKAQVAQAADEAKAKVDELYKTSKNGDRLQLRDRIAATIDQIKSEGLKFIDEQVAKQEEAQTLALAEAKAAKDTIDAQVAAKKAELLRLEEAKANSATIIKDYETQITTLGTEVEKMQKWVEGADVYFADYVRKCLQLQKPNETQIKRVKEAVSFLSDEELKKQVKEKFGE